MKGQEEVRVLYRSKEWMDGSIPSSNSMSALNLMQLGMLTMDEEEGQEKGFSGEALFERGKQLCLKVCQGEIVQKAPEAFYQMMLAADFLTDLRQTLVIAVPDTSHVLGDQPNEKQLFETIRTIFTPS